MSFKKVLKPYVPIVPYLLTGESSLFPPGQRIIREAEEEFIFPLVKKKRCKYLKQFETALPEQYEALKKQANYTSSWRERLDAVEKLSAYQHDKIIDLLKNRMQHDTVYKVQLAAYEALSAFGEDVEKPLPARFDIIKDTDKIFLRVKKSLPKDHTVADFADKLKRMRLDVFDAYEGDKGAEFMNWLEERWTKL